MLTDEKRTRHQTFSVVRERVLLRFNGTFSRRRRRRILHGQQRRAAQPGRPARLVFAPHIRVNAVAPAGIANRQLHGPEALGMEGQSQADIPRDMFLAKFPEISLFAEFPTPEDHAEIHVFLSHENRTITEQTMIADQGLLNRAVLTA
jgi:NAD(P)-dependent dehydrogenase (short-subunit alcohol dehydrogenase family)